MIKVIFVLPSLTSGGAERVISFLSQNLTDNRFSTELLITGKKSNQDYKIDRVPVFYLKKDRVLNSIWGIIRFLKRKKPKIVFSSLGHLNVVIGLISPLFPKTKFIIRPTNIASKEQRSWLANLSISWVNSIVCQSQDMATNFMELYNTRPEKITIIGNPITNKKELPVTTSLIKNNSYITVGRLNLIKGHARILNILAKLESDFHYTIIGDGPERENLIAQIRELGLIDKVTHIPYTSKVNDYLVTHSLFLQGSYSEGFPNAVLESCTMGTPVLAFNVPGGTREIIQNGVNGFLVNSEDEFLNAFDIEDNWERRLIRKSVTDKFSADAILKRYKALFNQVLNKP